MPVDLLVAGQSNLMIAQSVPYLWSPAFPMIPFMICWLPRAGSAVEVFNSKTLSADPVLYLSQFPVRFSATPLISFTFQAREEREE